MTVELSLLGKDTNYPTEYQPDILFPIARAPAREHYAHVEGAFHKLLLVVLLYPHHHRI